ncbi:MAG: hypothetical protein ACLUFN_06460 [Eubacterium sp.]
MKNPRLKAVYAVIVILGIAIIILSLLKITGTFDITSVINNSGNSQNNTEFIDEWKSEPFGKGNVTLTLKSRGKNLEYEFDNARGIEFGITASPIDYIKKANTSYDLFVFGEAGYHSLTKEVYVIEFVPLNCDYAMINNEKVELQSGKIKTNNEELNFNLLLTSYHTGLDTDGETENADCILIDKDGNTHNF